MCDLRVSDAISQADLTDSGARPFLPDKPDTFPLASEVVRKSSTKRLPDRCVRAAGSGCEADGCPFGGQQESFAKALAGGTVGTDHLHELGCRPGPRAPAPATKGRHFCTSVAPIAGKAPPPARAKAASALPVLAADEGPPTLEGLELDDTAAGHGPVAEAMLLQSRALAQLVSQIAQNSVEFGSQASSLSTRGTSSRQRMQAELTLREGHFATG